jgi:RNA polymerase sigma-70 factor (ECF subfamily)
VLVPGRPGQTPVVESEELVEAWRRARGEEDRQEAFRAIFRRFYPRVLRFFSSRGFSANDAQDLAQETLWRVYSSMAELRGRDRFETWLFTIALNVRHNALRAQAARKRSGSEVSLDAVSEPSVEPALNERREPSQLSQVLEHERRTLVRNAMQELPPQMRLCVLLRVDQGLKYREISTLLRISIETVKAHLFQARQKLKHELRGHFENIEI